MASPLTLKVAEVGAFKRRSPEDLARRTAALIAVIQIDQSFGSRPKKFEAINLVDGRDFLRETDTYDMVIVHSVVTPYLKLPKSAQKEPELRLSPDHTVEAWRERLVSTGAQYIVVCEGQPYTLSGRELGDLDGYEKVCGDEWLVVYRRKDD